MLDSKFVAVEGKIQGYAIVEYPVGLVTGLVDELKENSVLYRSQAFQGFAELEEEISSMQDQ